MFHSYFEVLYNILSIYRCYVWGNSQATDILVSVTHPLYHFSMKGWMASYERFDEGIVVVELFRDIDLSMAC